MFLRVKDAVAAAGSRAGACCISGVQAGAGGARTGQTTSELRRTASDVFPGFRNPASAGLGNLAILGRPGTTPPGMTHEGGHPDFSWLLDSLAGGCVRQHLMPRVFTGQPRPAGRGLLSHCGAPAVSCGHGCPWSHATPWVALGSRPSRWRGRLGALRCGMRTPQWPPDEILAAGGRDAAVWFGGAIKLAPQGAGHLKLAFDL